MNPVILYRSKYGATLRYAQWLAEELGCGLMENRSLTAQALAAFDTVVLGGGVHAGMIGGMDFLKKNWEALGGKRILVFAVGASPLDESMLAQLRGVNFSAPLTELPLFYCRGSWNEDKMKPMDRFIASMVKKASAKNPGSWMAELAATGTRVADWTDRAYLEPMIAALKAPSGK